MFEKPRVPVGKALTLMLAVAAMVPLTSVWSETFTPVQSVVVDVEPIAEPTDPDESVDKALFEDEMTELKEQLEELKAMLHQASLLRMGEMGLSKEE